MLNSSYLTIIHFHAQPNPRRTKDKETESNEVRTLTVEEKFSDNKWSTHFSNEISG